nr:MAG TPA: hypothetical protein [Caudoviricetes sp.]
MVKLLMIQTKSQNGKKRTVIKQWKVGRKEND